MLYINMETVSIGSQFTTTGQAQTGCQGMYGQGFTGIQIYVFHKILHS
jgi:hypothetical protein